MSASILIGGIAIAAFVTWAMGRSGRRLKLAVAYGSFAATVPTVVQSSARSNQAEGLAGIPYALTAAVVTYGVMIPSIIAIGIWEVERYKSRGRKGSRRA